jgi:hypothetical protein
MTETASDTLALLEPEDFFDAVNVDGDFVEFEGKKMKVRAMTGFEIFKTIKRFPKFRAFFVDVATSVFGENMADASDAMSRVNPRTIAELIADAGDEAVAAFIACVCFRPGDAAFEKVVSSGKRDGAIAAILSRGLELTMGGKSPEVFFTEKLELMEAMGLRKTTSKESKKPKRPLPTAANRTAEKSRKAA